MFFVIKVKSKTYIVNRKRKRVKSETTDDGDGVANSEVTYLECS